MWRVDGDGGTAAEFQGDQQALGSLGAHARDAGELVHAAGQQAVRRTDGFEDAPSQVGVGTGTQGQRHDLGVGQH